MGHRVAGSAAPGWQPRRCHRRVAGPRRIYPPPLGAPWAPAATQADDQGWKLRSKPPATDRPVRGCMHGRTDRQAGRRQRQERYWCCSAPGRLVGGWRRSPLGYNSLVRRRPARRGRGAARGGDRGGEVNGLHRLHARTVHAPCMHRTRTMQAPCWRCVGAVCAWHCALHAHVACAWCMCTVHAHGACTACGMRDLRSGCQVACALLVECCLAEVLLLACAATYNRSCSHV